MLALTLSIATREKETARITARTTVLVVFAEIQSIVHFAVAIVVCGIAEFFCAGEDERIAVIAIRAATDNRLMSVVVAIQWCKGTRPCCRLTNANRARVVAHAPIVVLARRRGDASAGIRLADFALAATSMHRRVDAGIRHTRIFRALHRVRADTGSTLAFPLTLSFSLAGERRSFAFGHRALTFALSAGLRTATRWLALLLARSEEATEHRYAQNNCHLALHHVRLHVGVFCLNVVNHIIRGMSS